MTSDPLARFLNLRSARYQRRGKLRPMNSSELSDVAVSVYQQLGGTILRHTAVPTIFCLAAVVFITTYVLPSFGVTSHPDDVKAQIGEAVSFLAIGVAVGTPLFIIGLGYSSAFITGVVSDFMTGGIPDSREAAQSGRKNLPRLCGLIVFQTLSAGSILIISGLLFLASAMFTMSSDSLGATTATTGLGFLALIVGAVAVPLVLSRQILAVPIMVRENLGARDVLKRCKELLKAYGNQPSGYSHAGSIFFLTALIGLFVLGGLSFCFGALDLRSHFSAWLAGSPFLDYVLQAVEYLPMFFALWLTIPIWASSATILYYERRARLEGYDIEALAADVLQHAKQNRFEL